MRIYFILCFCIVWSFVALQAQSKNPFNGSTDPGTSQLKQFMPKSPIPYSSLYFQTDLAGIKNTEAKMQEQTLGGVEDSPTYLQPGSVVLFKTKGGNFGKLQLLSFGHQPDNTAELYIRYTTFKPDGSALKSSEYMDLTGRDLYKSKSISTGNGNSGFIYLDNFLKKRRNVDKQSLEVWKKDSITYPSSAGVEWSISNNLLFLKPIELKQFLVTSDAEVLASEKPPKIIDSKEPAPSGQTTTNLKPQRRLALLIGNGAYPGKAALSNPVNDANDIATALREMGFEVVTATNTNRQKMEAAIEDFGTRLKNYNLGFFYYAGHGIQIDGENYLVPVDAKLKSQGEIRYECYPVGRVLAKMDEAAIQANVIVLDACRDNPFARSWSRSLVTGGLANINAPQGTFIGFATSPGSVADDGFGRNGIYTGALLQHIREPNLTVDQLFNAVSRTVKKLTNNQQVPWKASSMSEDLYLTK